MTITAVNNDLLDLVTYTWDTGSLPNPVINGGTLSVSNIPPGTYTVSLSASNQWNCANTFEIQIVSVDTSYIPSFTASTVSCPEDSIYIYEFTLDNPIDADYLWDFGDGNTLVSSDPSVQHIFQDYGEYVVSVSLLDLDNCGENDLSYDLDIIIEELQLDPNFSFVLSECTVDSTVISFQDESIISAIFGDNISYNWQFDNWGNSTDQNPSFTVYENESLNVCLTISTQDPVCTAQICQLIEVEVIDINLPDQVFICYGQSIVLNPQGSDEYAYTWSPDENISDPTSPSPTVFPTTTTLYTVSVDNGLCSSTDSILVEVDDPINVDIITGDSIVNCYGLAIELIANTSPSATSINWYQDLDDNPIGSGGSISVNPSDNTWYYVVASTDNNCTATDSILVVVPSYDPEVTILGDPILCPNSETEILLSSTTTITYFPTYQWYEDGLIIPGATEPTLLVSPTQNTTYTLVVTDGFGCQADDNFSIEVGEFLSINLSQDAEASCFGSPVELTATTIPSSLDVVWYEGGTPIPNGNQNTILVTPTNTTTYVAVATDALNCQIEGQINVTVPENEVIVAIEGPDFKCFNTEETLTLIAVADPADMIVSYEWTVNGQISQGGASIDIVNPLVNTTVGVVVIDSFGCIAEDEFEIQITDSFNFEIVADNFVSCLSSPITFTTDPVFEAPYTVEWYDQTNQLGTGSTFIYTPDGSFTLTTVVTDEYGCQVSQEADVIDPMIDIDVEITGDNAFCQSQVDDVTLTANVQAVGAVSYQWFENGETLQGETTNQIVVSPDLTTTYSVEVVDEFGCVDDASFVLSVGDSLYVVDDETFICYYEEDPLLISLEHSDLANLNYLWTWGSPVMTSTEPSFLDLPLTNTTYTLTIQDEFGCEASGTLFVLVSDSLSVFIEGSDVNCLTDTEPIILTAITDGLYSSIQWEENGITQDQFNGLTSISVNPSQNTNYTVNIIDSLGCVTSASKLVETPEPFEVWVDSILLINCQTDPEGIVVTAQSSLSNIQFTWLDAGLNNIGSGNTIVLNPTATSTYYLVGEDVYGCVDTFQFTIQVPDITLEISADDGVNCLTDDEPVTITATSNIPGTTFEWFIIENGEPILYSQGDTLVVDPNQTTEYLVVATDPDGCQVSTMVTITVPDITLEVNIEGDTLNCLSDLEDLYLTATANDDATFVWNTGSTDNPLLITPEPGTTTTYTVVATQVDFPSCFAESSITVITPDSLYIDVPDAISCTNIYNIGVVGSNPPAQINWELSTGDGANYQDQTSFEWMLSQDDIDNTFTVEYTDIYGCFVSESGIVQNGTIDLDYQSIYYICPGDTLTISAENLDDDDTLSYNWSIDGNGQIISDNGTSITITTLINTQAIVTLQVSNQFNCDEIITFEINTSNFDPAPLEDITICYDSDVELYPGANPDYEYLWALESNIATSVEDPNPTTVSLFESTMFYVTISDPLFSTNEFCVEEDSMMVKVLEEINLSISTDVASDTLCELIEVNLTANVDGALDLEYEWTANGTIISTNQSVNVIPDNTIVYEVTAFHSDDSAYCAQTDSITLYAYPLEVELIDTTDICLGDDLWLEVFDNADQELTYLWTPNEYIVEGDITDSRIRVQPTQDITYTVIVTNSYGCTEPLRVKINVIDVVSDFNATAEPNEIIKYFGENPQLNASFGPNSEWFGQESQFVFEWLEFPDNQVLDDAFIPDPIAIDMLETTDFVVFYQLNTDYTSCQSTDTVRVTVVSPQCEPPFVFVPNLFSPNGDDMNDKLHVYGDNIEEYEFTIYNRWGQKVYEETQDSPNKGWKGTFKGEPLGPDVYGYTLIAKCIDLDERRFFKGNITLMR